MLLLVAVTLNLASVVEELQSICVEGCAVITGADKSAQEVNEVALFGEMVFLVVLVGFVF